MRTATCLIFIEFDALTTLPEEVRNPRRTVPRATAAVCLFTDILGGGLVYLAHSVWPDHVTFPQIATAFLDVARRVGGAGLSSNCDARFPAAPAGSRGPNT